MKIKVHSVNISEKKGTIKIPVDHIQLSETGVQGDAHSGHWHRQVSLLGNESFETFSKEAGRKINFGEFAENITTEGLLLYKTMPLDRFSNEHIELEVTQIGKKCHGDSCAIFREVGNCVMPKEGIFARVIRSGRLQPGDELTYQQKVFKILVVTLSDRASKGEYEDKSGPKIAELITEHYSGTNRAYELEYKLIADDPFTLEKILLCAKKNRTDFVFTTGGTGIGPRDITPEVVKPLLDKEIPGIMEMIRVKYGAEKPNALLSRGVAGLMGSTFVYSMPGSVKAVTEYLTEILKTNDHLMYMLNGLDMH